MGNKIIGKRSRNFYRGFNQRQLAYLRDKFETFSEGGALKKQLFCSSYQIDEKIFDSFSAQANFDDEGGVDEYEFICIVSYICNLTTEELGKTFFSMIADKKGTPIKQQQLLPFTRVCLKYNAYVTGGEVKDAEIKKINRDKFKKYDYDKNKSIDCAEFCSICLKDADYKNWLFNMGFITKNQMDHHDQIYDLVDSDIGEEVERQLRENNPNVDRIKRGLENRQGDDQFQPQIQVGQQSTTPKEKPWLQGFSSYKSAEFTDQSVPSLSEQAPSQLLSLDYVLGYRSFDCRNNLRFDSKDQIIYHQAALGIVLSPSKSGNADFNQIFLNEHKDDITCLDNAGDKVVTGQAGTSPMIIIWNTKNIDNGALKSEFIITKGLKESVGNVCLSPSQKLIAATCNDEDHSLVVYDLQQLKQNQNNLTSTKTGIVCAGPLIKCLVFDIKFEQDEQSLVAATIRELLFICIDKGVINSSRGDFGQFSSTMALCLLPIVISGGKGPKRYQMVSGMGNGSIYFWQKGKCIKALVGHSGSVSVLTKRSDCNSFISGDKTGRIIFWNELFAKQRELNVAKTNSPSNMIVSLCHGSKKQLLIGTKGSNVFLLNSGDPIEKAVTVASGHSDGMIWTGVIGDKCLFTGGEDQRLIKWDYQGSKKAVKEVKCMNKIRSIDYNGKTKMLAVGFVNGQIIFYKADTLEKVQNLTFSKIKNPDQQALNIVRFQSYGRFIMVSYSYPKTKIVFLSCDKELKIIGELQLKFKAIAFDLTKTDKQPFFLRCNQVSPMGQIYQVYELTTEKDKIRSKQIKQAKQKIIKAEWHTHTCPFTPQTRSIISQGVEEKDITCVTRSMRYRNVIVAGDRFSKLKLFNYPCPFNKIYNKYDGHSNSVTAIIFSPEEDYLITIGGEQKAIFIWKYDPVLIKNPYVVDSLSDEFETQEEIGVQSTSTPAFKGQIFAPRDFVSNPRKENQVPKENVKVKHAFGVRSTYLSDEVRNQCKLTLDCQDILFPTACMAIKMNIETRKQDIFLEHKEDIVSFAVDRERKLMATGQMAERNLKEPLKKILSIYVWDIENKTSLVKLDGFHTIAVVLLEFSPSGKLLFSCGNDQKNSFAVYDWRAKTILYSGPVSRAKVNGIVWRSQTQFATCGNDHVKFWQNGKGRLGEFAPAKTEAQFSIASSGNVYITGGGNGNLFVWNGNKGPACLKAHTKKVQCLVDRKNFLYSGGDDGKILRWKKKTNGSIQNAELCLDTRSAFPQRKMGKQIQYGILSLDFGPDNDQTFLYLTKGCSIIISQRGKFKIVTQGHCSGQLWGLATSSNKDLLVTGGDDATVRMWDIQKREEIGRANFQRNIRAVDWSTRGDRIICADAKVKIALLDQNLNQLSVYSGKPAQNNKNGKGWVQQIKFSPNNQLVVYGTHGKSNIIQFLKVQGKNVSLLNSFDSGISSATLHIDWSRDSQNISVNSRAAELLFFNITTKGKNLSASSFREQKWATWTQKFGFPVQGIFQGPSFEDIHTCCRDPAGKFLAVGYNDQTIRLFKYPCYIPRQVHKTYYGHSSHVTRVRFTPHYMVSIGGLDRTIIIWDIDRGEQYQKQANQGESQDELSDLDDEVDLPRKIMTNRKKKKKVEEQFKQIETSGDEFMAVKPWLGAIKEPTYPFPKQSANKPNADIQLQYVHGYRTKDCRQNLYFNDQRTLIYHAAAVLIYHDTRKNTQQLFTDHSDDILSIDFHKSSGGVVTGQLGPKPIVNYYKDAKLISTFKSPVTKGVLALAISPDGSKAIATGMDDDHMVAVLDLKKGTVIAKQKGGKKVILKAGWITEEEFVTVGIRHFKYWTLDGSKLKAKDGNEPGNFVSLAISKDKMVLTGASAGTIYSWKGNSGKLAVKLKRPILERVQDAQQEQQLSRVSVVESISIQKGFIAAGTKDGHIFILSEKLQTLNCFAMNQILSSFGLVSQHPAVRSIDFLNDKMLIGTFGSEIFQLQCDKISVKNAKIQDAVCHVKAHYSPNNTWTNQVWGLYVDGDLAFSCSDDATLRCWGIQERKLYSIASLNLVRNEKNQWQQSAKDDKTNDFYESSKGRSVCLSPDKKFIIVGCKEGTVRLFRYSEKDHSMQMHQIFKHAKEWISQIKFGFNLLIIGSHDNGIYVYDYDPEAGSFKRKYKPMKKHSSYITHIDVSRDSCYLQSTCGAYELLFWDLNTGRQITSGGSMLKDERWATWTCTLGWPVQGIYPKCTDGTFIHSVDRSHSSIKGTMAADDPRTPYLLAGGNNNGEICIYSYPCTIKNSGYVAGVGHSSHVTNVRWTNNDDRIISVGGEDQCVMYWKVRKNR